MRSIAILGGLCLMLTGAAASGAPLRSSSSTGSAPIEASATRTHGPRVAKVVLLGNRAIESRVDGHRSGAGEAFAFRARRSGTATSISVYLDNRDRANALFAGLYSSRHGRPHSLMTSGSRRSPKAGAWNRLAVRAARLRRGTTYWLALLGKGGAIYFRDRNGRSCRGQRSFRLKMLSLPRTWHAGPNSHACRISAYVKGIGRVSSGTGGGGGTNAPGRPTTTPTGTPTSPGAPTDEVQPYFGASVVSKTTGACAAGCAIEGQQLSVTPGMWSHNPAFAYQWQDCITNAGTDTGATIADSGSSHIMTPPTTGSCANISGATSSTYTVQASDVGKALAVNVTATNSHGSTSTTTAGTCNTGLMTTTWTSSTNPATPVASAYFDNGQPGCSPISAVVGRGQYGTGAAGQHFCTNAPISCGFADIANAGVPHGTALYAVPGTCTSPSGPGTGCANTGTGWSYSSGHITVSGGAVLQNVSVAAGTNTASVVEISGTTANVTIQDSDISGGCNCVFTAAGGLINLSGSGGNITIRNNNLHGIDASTAGDGCNAAVFAGASTGANIVVDSNNIYWCSTGLNQIKANGAWTIANNYIHDFAYADSGRSNHFDGIQPEGGGSSSSPMNFVNNTDLMDVDQTAPVILSTDNNVANSYRWIAHNLLAGGDLAIYVTGDATYPTTHSAVLNNAFSQIYMGDHNTRSLYGSGSFGPTGYWTASTNTWTTNNWDDTGGVVSPNTCTTGCP